MLRIRDIDGGDWRGREYRFGECFHCLFRRSSVFGANRFSYPFGTPDFGVCLSSYPFPTDDDGVTEKVIDIHESLRDREDWEKWRALDADAEHLEFLARCDRRRNRKKSRKR